jgi:hypothetical protein
MMVTDLLQVVPTRLIQAVRNKLLRACCHQLVNNLLVVTWRRYHLFKDVLEVLDYIGSILDGGKQTDVVYMDMSKVFDKVNQQILNSEIKKQLWHGSLLYWLDSYLSQRKRVTILGAMPSTKPVLSGVPQGSILGPLLSYST